MSDSNQNHETTCNSKLKFAELKDFLIKRVQKNYLKMNYVATQLTQHFQSFDFSAKDITSDHGFLLRLVNTFTVDTEEYSLLKVHDAKTFKNLVVSFYALCSQITGMYYYCRLVHLKKNVDLVLYIIAFDQKDLNYICQISSLVKG